jgi:hypothetical protein
MNLLRITGQERKKFLILAALFGIYAVLAQLATGSVCVSQAVLGVPCPGCGLTRAFLSFFTLGFREAFWWHPLFWYVPIMLGVYIFKRIRHGGKPARWFTMFMLISFILFIAVFAVGMFFKFPHTQPMIINKRSSTMRVIFFFVNLFK